MSDALFVALVTGAFSAFCAWVNTWPLPDAREWLGNRRPAADAPEGEHEA